MVTVGTAGGGDSGDRWQGDTGDSASGDNGASGTGSLRAQNSEMYRETLEIP
jgi:hypothetical protein